MMARTDDDDLSDLDSETTEMANSNPEQPKKRGPGRPKGTKNGPDAGKGPGKRPVGRPPKNASQASTGMGADGAKSMPARRGTLKPLGN